MKKVSFATKTSFLLITMISAISSISFATQYYSNGAAAPSSFVVGNWWTNTNGTGSNPTDFTNSSDIFTIQSGDTLILGSTTTVAGSLDIASGGVFDDGGFTLNLGTDFTNAGTFTASGTINFNGGGAQSIDNDGPFNVFQVNKSGGTLTANSTVTANGAINVTSGTFDLNGNNLIANSTTDIDGGTLTLTTGTYDFGGLLTLSSGTLNAGTGTLAVAANFTKSGGTFNEETATFSFVENGTSTITSNSNISFDKIVAAPNSASGARILNFTGTGATRTFTIKTSFERGQRSQGTSRTSATLVFSSGATLIYSPATSAMTIDSDEWPTSNGPDNVIFQGSIGLTLPGSTARTIPLGGKFTQKATAALTLSSTLTINGTYERQSHSSSVTGTISYGTGGTLSYNITSGGAVSNLSEWSGTNAPDSVIINTSTSITGGNSKTIDGSLRIISGTLSLGSNTLTVKGDVVGSEIAGSGTINSATTLLIGDSTPANSTQDQTISGTITLTNLIINKSGQGGGVSDNLVTVSGTITLAVSSSITVTNGTLQLTADGKLASNLGTLTLTVSSGGRLETGGQGLQNIGTLSASSGTIAFNGTSGAETLPGGFTIGTVILNNSSNFTIESSTTLTVGTNLTLTSGKVTTSSTETLLLGASATISGTPSSSKMIVGPMRKAFSSGDVAAFTFPVGYSSTYLPAIFDYSANTVGTSIIEIEARSGGPGGTPPSGISSVASDHYYTTKEVGTGGTFTYDITLTYTGTGLNPDARNKIIRQIGATPTYQFDSVNNGTAAGGVVTLSSQTALPTNTGIFAFGSGGATVYWDNTSSDGLWLTASNWDGDVIPGSEDDVIIDNTVPGSFTVLLNGSTSQTVKTLVIGQDGGNTITLNITNSNSTPLAISGTGTALNVNQDGVLTLNGTTGGISMSGSGNVNFDNSSVLNITTGTGIATSGTVTYGASSTVNIAANSGLTASSYGNLNLSATSASLSSGTLTVQGNLQITSGSTTFSLTSILNVTGTTSISNGASLDLTGTGSRTFTGAVTNNGDFNISGSSGTITINGAYTGTGTLDATGANPAISFNSTFGPTGSTTFGSQSLIFNNTITLNGGVFTPSSNTDLQNGVTTFTFNGGSIGSTTGRPLVFDKSNGSQTIAVTSGGGAFQELTINNSNNVSGSNNFSVNGILTLTSGTLAMGANTLTLGTSGSNLGTLSGTGTISGSFARWFAASTVSNVRFPLVSGGSDRLVNLSYTAAPTAGTVTASFISSSPGDGGLNITDGAYTISTITNDGYWSVTSSNGGTYSLDLNAPGFGGITNDASVQFLHLIRRNTGNTNWSVDGTHSAGTGTSTQPVIHRTGMTLYGEVTIGSNLSDNSLPVEMVSFSAKTTYDMVKINWETETESNNAGFVIMRKAENSAEFVSVNNSLVKSKNSTSANRTKYEFTDKSGLEEGTTYTYKIRSVDLGGQVHDYKLSSEVKYDGIPKELILNQNYPNPFNPTTTIDVFFPKDVKVSVEIYNILGQNIRTLYSGEKEKGLHSFLWNGKDNSQKSVSSGVYFYQVITPDGQKLKKMTLMK